MSNKHRKVYTTLNDYEHLMILASAVTGRDSISAVPYVVSFRIGITKFSVGFKIWAISAPIKIYKWMIPKKKKKYHKIVLLANYNLNSIAVIIIRALIEPYISHNELGLVNDLSKELGKMKEAMKRSKISTLY